MRGAPRSDGGGSDEHFAEAVRFVGEMRGWLRWRAGRVHPPVVPQRYPFAQSQVAA